MANEDPLVRLPEEVTLTFAEAAAVLLVLDVALERAAGRPERVEVIAARRLLTGKLWPELGDLLEQPDAGEEH